jgi:hypothetical protein
VTFDELDELLAVHGGRRTSPTSSTRHCPGHDDHTASLALKEADDGKILLFCRAGCSTSSVLEVLGLDFGDLNPTTSTRARHPHGGGSIPAALRRTLARERRHADRNDLYRVSDLRRVVQRHSEEVSRRATALGPDHPAAWVLVKDEAQARCDVAVLDVRLDRAITSWRMRARHE